MKLTKHPLAIGAGLAAGLAPLAYPLFLRRRCLTWGARADEAAMKLPGDELLPHAGLVTTRAITIDAPPGRHLAVARADGQRPRRRLHLRLDREPPRPEHAQCRRDPSRVPGRQGRRRTADGAQPASHAGRGARPGTDPRVPDRRRELGVDLRTAARD